MTIKFLGTGAAEGVPAMFCNCQFCTWARGQGMREVRTRTQVLVDDGLLIDFPPEAYYHSIAHGVNLSSVETLLVTHSHMDHCYAHDFILRGYKYARLGAPVLNIYGNEEVAKVFSECTAREMKPEVAPHICFNQISPYSIFTASGYRVAALPAERLTLDWVRQNTVVVHYLGKPKPWQKNYIGPLGVFYKEELALTQAGTKEA